ncbi:MAG: T9SS type A sorting domain-containing protein [Bacteroidetes bacterium]|nr:T9SS type A sorting domain-containing protein [Bacteroidota bacterium]
MKKYTTLFLFLFFSANVFSQSYVWSTLGSGVSGTVFASAYYNGKLIVAGSFTSAGTVTVNNIAAWDGSSWTALGTGTTNTIRALCVYHGQLYASGSFLNAGGVAAKRIARWNGTQWDSVGHGINGASVYALEVYHDQLYAAGKFGLAGYTIVNNIGVWNDTAWSAVGNGISSVWGTSTVYCLRTFSNEIYAGGLFDLAGNDSISYSIAKWNGNSWSHVGEGFDYTVYCLEPLGGILYAGGDFYWTTGYHLVNNFAQWDGTQWMAAGGGADNIVRSLTHYGTDIYLGGDFVTAGSTSAIRISRWDGTTFYPLGGGVDNTVNAISADEGIVFAAGALANAGGSPASHIAKWSIAGVGISEISAPGEITIFPNPSDGIFNIQLKNTSGENIIEVYNVNGEKINSFALKKETAQINLSGEAEGIYFYRILADGNLISEGKFIVE